METYLLIISLFQAFAKGLSFVRIFDDYGFLVRMIGLTVNELIPFMAFFFVYTLLFAIAFMIMGIKLDHTRPGTLVEAWSVSNRPGMHICNQTLQTISK